MWKLGVRKLSWSVGSWSPRWTCQLTSSHLLPIEVTMADPKVGEGEKLLLRQVKSHEYSRMSMFKLTREWETILSAFPNIWVLYLKLLIDWNIARSNYIALKITNISLRSLALMSRIPIKFTMEIDCSLLKSLWNIIYPVGHWALLIY